MTLSTHCVTCVLFQRKRWIWMHRYKFWIYKIYTNISRKRKTLTFARTAVVIQYSNPCTTQANTIPCNFCMPLDEIIGFPPNVDMFYHSANNFIQINVNYRKELIKMIIILGKTFYFYSWIQYFVLIIFERLQKQRP